MKLKMIDGRALVMIVLAAVSAISFMTGTFAPALRTPTHGFPVYYTSARLIVEGRWSSRVYDDGWYGDQVAIYFPSPIREIYGANPPGVALLLLPLVSLTAADARAVWLIINLCLLVVAVMMLMSALAMNSLALRAGFVALVFTYAPLHENFRLGQAYGLLLFLLAMTLWLLKRDRSAWAGVPLGLTVVTKMSGVPVGLMLIAQRRWRSASAVMVTGFAVFILSLAVVGLESWTSWVSIALNHFGGLPSSGVTAFQTTPSFFQHLFVADARWNPDPIWQQPWLASALSIGISLAALAVTLWKGRRADVDLALAAAATLSVVLVPVAEEYHYTLLLLPLAVVIAWLVRAPINVRDALALGVIAMLLAVPWNYKSDQIAHGWAALLAYPRLYGGWLLWAWSIKRMSAHVDA